MTVSSHQQQWPTAKELITIYSLNKAQYNLIKCCKSNRPIKYKMKQLIYKFPAEINTSALNVNMCCLTKKLEPMSSFTDDSHNVICCLNYGTEIMSTQTKET